MRLNEINEAKVEMKSLVSALKGKFPNMKRLGGASRIYEVGNKKGVIYLLDDKKAFGLIWSKSAVESVCVWNNFKLDNQPDVIGDIPSDATMGSIGEPIVNFINNPKIGLVEDDGEEFDTKTSPIYGRNPDGTFFEIPRTKEISAKIEKAFIQAKNKGKEDALSMEEQYELLEFKVSGLVNGKTNNVKSLLITGMPSAGKALSLDTELPSPNGWTTMGDVSVEDLLFDENGDPCKVTSVTPVQLERDCFKITFDDGTNIVADGDHRWLTSSVNVSNTKHNTGLSTTSEISVSMKSDEKWTHRIYNSKPVKYSDKELPIEPYELGLWLGGSHSDYEKNVDKLKGLGLLEITHIPRTYLEGGVGQRIDLLSGLINSAGQVNSEGGYNFTTDKLELYNDFHELVNTLGIKPNGNEQMGIYTCSFVVDENMFINSKKLTNNKEIYRTIVSCEPVDSVPVKCITVDSASHLFLCSRSFIPTHNTFRVMNVIKKSGLQEGKDYITKTGKITPKALYRVLIEQLNGLAIFDDCDSVTGSDDGVNMLKGALDTGEIRTVDYDVQGALNTGAMSFERRGKVVNAMSNILRNDATIDDVELIETFMNSKERAAARGENIQTGAVSKKKSTNWDDLTLPDDYDPHDPRFYDEENEEYQKRFGTGEEPKGEVSQQRILANVKWIETNLPNKIDYYGRVIFISNMSREKWLTIGSGAIMTRAMYQDMNFSDLEMLDFIEQIKQHLPSAGLSIEQKSEVMDFLRDAWEKGKIQTAINFRLVQQAFDFYSMDNGNGTIWKKLIIDL